MYNYKQSRARRLVECAFGMMIKKFRVLEHPMLVHPDVAIKITLAYCALHNMIRKREGKLTDVYDELMTLEQKVCDTLLCFLTLRLGLYHGKTKWHFVSLQTILILKHF